MVIKSSAAAEIRQLIAALAADDVVAREAAIARLGILGDRAVDRLLAAYTAGAGRDARLAILRALEPAADPRALDVAGRALDEGGDVAIAATAVLRGLLAAPQGDAAARALDRLVAVALDRGAARTLRLAACDALQDVPGGVRARVAAALELDPDAGFRMRLDDAPRAAAATDAVWRDALDGRLPERPDALREAVQTKAFSATFGVLQKLVDAVRVREGGVGDAAERSGWVSVRGALHQALALRGSRVAVYDLRESLERAREPLPPSFMAALHVVGDPSCLEPLAAAYARSTDPRWRVQVKEAFRAVARREKLSRRHAAIKRIVAKWPEAGRDLFAD
jgi:hypothetical protein